MHLTLIPLCAMYTASWAASCSSLATEDEIWNKTTAPWQSVGWFRIPPIAMQTVDCCLQFIQAHIFFCCSKLMSSSVVPSCCCPLAAILLMLPCSMACVKWSHLTISFAFIGDDSFWRQLSNYCNNIGPSWRQTNMVEFAQVFGIILQTFSTSTRNKSRTAWVIGLKRIPSVCPSSSLVDSVAKF